MISLPAPSIESAIGYKLEDKVDAVFMSNERLTLEMSIERWVVDKANINVGTGTDISAYKRDTGRVREVLKIIQIQDVTGTHFKVFYSDNVSLE